MACLIHPMLREDAAQIDLTGFGRAVGLLAAPPFQFLRPQGHTRSVPADIQDRCGIRSRRGGPFLPGLRGGTHPLHDPLNLPGRNLKAAGLFELPLGFEIGACVGPFQTKQFGQGWSVAHFQSQRGLGGVTPLFLARVIVVVALAIEAAKNPLPPDRFPALANLPKSGLVTGIDPLGGRLEQPADEVVGRLENSRAHQHLQSGDGVPLRIRGLKPGDQLLDFRFLGQEDRGGDGLFFDAAMSCRVSAIPRWAYCSVSSRNWA